MNMTIQVTPAVDELMNEYNDLAFAQNVDNMWEYARRWKVLALRAEAKGRPALAAMCDARATHYGSFTGGEYVKLVDGPLAEWFETQPCATGAESRTA